MNGGGLGPGGYQAPPGPGGIGPRGGPRGPPKLFWKSPWRITSEKSVWPKIRRYSWPYGIKWSGLRSGASASIIFVVAIVAIVSIVVLIIVIVAHAEKLLSKAKRNADAICAMIKLIL